MKKLICFILLFILLFSLTACFETGKTDNPNTANEFEAIHAALAAPDAHFTLSVLTKTVTLR